MNCSRCGKALIEGANFCQHCGAPVKAKPAEGETVSGTAPGTEIHIDVGHNEGQVIGKVNASGGQPVHIGGQQRYGDEVHGPKIDLGGGTYIESAQTGGGDLVLGDKIGRDVVHGDNIQGDKIVASGAGAQATVSRGLDAAALAALFQEVNRNIDRLPERDEIDKDELKDTAGRLEKEIGKGEQANPERIKRWMDVLEKYAPDVVEILVNALLNPAAGAASAVKAVLKQFAR
jgi:hypothetical protein